MRKECSGLRFFAMAIPMEVRYPWWPGWNPRLPCWQSRRMARQSRSASHDHRPAVVSFIGLSVSSRSLPASFVDRYVGARTEKIPEPVQRQVKDVVLVEDASREVAVREKRPRQGVLPGHQGLDLLGRPSMQHRQRRLLQDEDVGNRVHDRAAPGESSRARIVLPEPVPWMRPGLDGLEPGGGDAPPDTPGGLRFDLTGEHIGGRVQVELAECEREEAHRLSCGN